MDKRGVAELVQRRPPEAAANRAAAAEHSHTLATRGSLAYWAVQAGDDAWMA